MGEFFANDTRRALYLQAWADFVEQVDSGTRTPKQALQRLQSNLPGNKTKKEIAGILVGTSKGIAHLMETRIAAILAGTEV